MCHQGITSELHYLFASYADIPIIRKIAIKDVWTTVHHVNQPVVKRPNLGTCHR